METFTWIVGLLLGAALLVPLARRIGAPYPALMALAGVAVAFIPGAPEIRIEPEVALALFIAPILVDAGFDASLRDLRDNWLPVSSLALVVVALTTAAVAWVVKLLFPDMPWAAAIALGALVAPPDAASTTAVLGQLKAPGRIKTILEGESLINDSGSLIIYRLAVAAAGGAAVAGWSVVPRFVLVAVGSIALGMALGWLFWWIGGRLRDPAVAILAQFSSGFAVWILGEELHLSPVITVVVYAVTIAHLPDRVGARLRIPSYAVWSTVVFVLNAFAFLLIGLQIDDIVLALDPAERNLYLTAGAAVLATVIGVRFGWVMLYNAVLRLKNQRLGTRLPRPGIMVPNFRAGVVIGWAGMRGILSLAAALALPENFPFREVLVFLAFCVVLGTLLIQGLTLGPLIKALGLEDDGAIDREVRTARTEGLRAALATLDGQDGEVAAAIRRELELTLEAAETSDRAIQPQAPHADLRRTALEAARAAVTRLRRSGAIGDDAFHQVEEEIDWAEMSARAEAPL